jgi:hypothetical protein
MSDIKACSSTPAPCECLPEHITIACSDHRDRDRDRASIMQGRLLNARISLDFRAPEPRSAAATGHTQSG